MKLAAIGDIIQWMLGNDTKTVRVKRDRQRNHWGLFSCDIGNPNSTFKFDMHVHDLLLKDVQLNSVNHYQGECGVIGYAEGKPVTDLERQPDASQRKSLSYDRVFHKFVCDGKYVESAKYVWVHSDGTASAIL